MSSASPGDRVLLVRCTDEWITIRPGTCGTVTFVDDFGTVFVQWDNGRTLGLIQAAGDLCVPVDPRMECGHSSRGYTECKLPQGHTGDKEPEKQLHSDLTLLWDDDGYLCNLDGSRI